MYNFIKIQYDLGNIDAERVNQFAILGWITKAQAKEIIGG